MRELSMESSVSVVTRIISMASQTKVIAGSNAQVMRVRYVVVVGETLSMKQDMVGGCLLCYQLSMCKCKILKM